MLTARVITCSDAASRGYSVDEIIVVPDSVAAIASQIEIASAAGVRLVVTTGGTGLSPRDVTPEATMSVCERAVPGFGELMRLRSLEKTKMAALSRAQAATRGASLIITLPGSERAAVENLEAVLDLIPHALDLLSGEKVEVHP